MTSLSAHYCVNSNLTDTIRKMLDAVGRNLSSLTTKDLTAVDEFHIRGCKATLAIVGQMRLNKNSHTVIFVKSDLRNCLIGV